MFDNLNTQIFNERVKLFKSFVAKLRETNSSIQIVKKRIFKEHIKTITFNTNK